MANAAEAEIDRRISLGHQSRLIIPARELGIDESIWNEFLRRKYIAAGWKKAEWGFDAEEWDFIALFSGET